jgi:hypothetical protein
MNGQTIRERVTALKAEIEELREKNREYLKVKHHTHSEILAHRERGDRLRQILDELETLSKERFRQ